MALQSTAPSQTQRNLHTAAFAATTLLAVYYAFFGLDLPSAENAFINWGYLNIVLLTACFAWSCRVPIFEATTGAWKKRQIVTLFFVCLAGALYLYSREGGGFKISFDEEVLSNVAQNLYRDQLPLMRESTLQGVARFEMIDKRPLLFPFLLSLFHTILGYEVQNAFYLNFCLTAAYLFLLSSIVKRVSNSTAGYFAIALACFMPLIGQNASGGGFDMLNISITLLVVWMAIGFWEKPGPESLTRLAFATALVAHVRYESSILGLPVLLLIIAHWIRSKRIHIPLSLAILPLTYMPVIWQLRAINANPQIFQYKVDGNGSFSFSYLADNLSRAYNFLLVPSDFYAGSPFITLIGTAGLLLFLAKRITDKHSVFEGNPVRVALAVMSIYPITHFCLIMIFYFGQFDDPIVSRLSLPTITLFIAAGGMLLAFLFRKQGGYRALSLLLVLATGLYASKMYSTHSYSTSGEIAHRSEWSLEFADSLPKGNYLFLTTMPRIFELHGYNNMTLDKARIALDKIKLHLDLNTYDEVYIIQNGQIEQTEEGVVKSLLPLNDLGPAVELETLDEVTFSPFNFCRLSRIQNIDIALDTPPESESQTFEKTPQIRRVNKEMLDTWKRSLP